MPFSHRKSRNQICNKHGSSFLIWRERERERERERTFKQPKWASTKRPYKGWLEILPLRISCSPTITSSSSSSSTFSTFSQHLLLASIFSTDQINLYCYMLTLLYVLIYKREQMYEPWGKTDAPIFGIDQRIDSCMQIVSVKTLNGGWHGLFLLPLFSVFLHTRKQHFERFLDQWGALLVQHPLFIQSLLVFNFPILLVILWSLTFFSGKRSKSVTVHKGYFLFFIYLFFRLVRLIYMVHVNNLFLIGSD